MTAADRLRAAMEERCAVWKAARNKDHFARCGICQIALAAVLPIVEELERDAERYRHLRRHCQYGFEDHDDPQLVHRNGKTAAHQNPRWREDLDAAIDAARKGERDGEG